jgi:hypothetical protein
LQYWSIILEAELMLFSSKESSRLSVMRSAAFTSAKVQYPLVTAKINS